MRDLAAGMEAQQLGLDLVEEHNQRWVDRMRWHAREIAQAKGGVTTDDLREIADKLGVHPEHRNAWGSIFRGPSWRVIGYQRSERPSNHGRRIAIWGLAF